MLHVEDWGEGPALLLLHGAPSPITDFAPVVDRLRGTRRILAPHLPGYGKSPALDGTYSHARVRDAVVAELLARDIGELAIAGFSLGATHALALALDPRLRVTHVVSLAGLARYQPEIAAQNRQFVAALRAGADLSSPDWRAIAKQIFTSDPARYGEQVADWLKLASPATLADDIEATIAMDLRPRLPEVTADVYLRVGELDQATPPSCSQEIAGLCPRARLDIVPGVGHALLLEDADATAKAVEQALSR